MKLSSLETALALPFPAWSTTPLQHQPLRHTLSFYISPLVRLPSISHSLVKCAYQRAGPTLMARLIILDSDEDPDPAPAPTSNDDSTRPDPNLNRLTAALSIYP